MSHNTTISSDDSQSQAETEHLVKISNDSTDMQTILGKINEVIKSFRIPPFIDESFIVSMIESDITINIEFFTVVRENEHKVLVLIDSLNGLYLPFSVFLSAVIPAYITIQLRSAFSELSSIRSILDDIASEIQDELERVTLAVSEEEFKEAKFNKKDISKNELNDILSTHTLCKKQSDALEDCPLCGKEDINHYYECNDCHYKYCAKCCEEIASRQALCPCCREELRLIEHVHD